MTTKDISLNSKVISSVKFKTLFCDKWEEIETGLTMLQSALKNPIAKLAITIVIDAGSAIHTKVCG